MGLSSAEGLPYEPKWAFPLLRDYPMGLSGLEPPTSRLSGVRSNQLSYKPLAFYSVTGNGDGEIRTLDPLLARQVLSQLSYTPMRTTIQIEKEFLLSYGLKWAFPLLRDYPMSLSGPFLC